MARETKNARGTQKEERKTYKNQPFTMVGKLVKFGTFGKEDAHGWLVVAEETNDTMYTIKKFNLSDDEYDLLSDAKVVEVGFNLSYSKNGNDIALQIVANSIKKIG